MKKYLSDVIAIAILIAMYNHATAQNNPESKANYRQAERFSPDKMSRMVFSTSVNPNWLETGDKFWYSYKNTESENFWMVEMVS